MSDFNITTSQTVDTFLSTTAYNNTLATRDRIFISEGAVLSQPPASVIDVLYTADLTLGENSTGTAVLKEGDIEITRPGFELYINPITVIFQDALAPAIPTLTTVLGIQDDASDVGYTRVTLNWSALLNNERLMADLGLATGTYQTMLTPTDQIQPATDTVYEVTGYDPFGGSSTLDRDFNRTENLIRVVDSTGFAVGQLVEIDDGTKVAYYKLLSDGTAELQLDTRCNYVDPFAAGSTVRTVTFIEKIRDIDYTMNYMDGKVNLLDGQFTAGNSVVLSCIPTLVDLDHYELYRVPGDHIVNPTAAHTLVTRDAVMSTAGYQIVNLNIPMSSTSATDTLLPQYNSQTWTYYLFAVDDNTPENVSFTASVMIETIPTKPQNPQISVGDRLVYLSWDALPATEDNTNGFNVYRCDGTVFNPTMSIKVNDSLINTTTPFFEDSRSNTTNRRPEAEVPVPLNGQAYTYRIESEDSVSAWQVGTKNADSETGAANYYAVKNIP